MNRVASAFKPAAKTPKAESAASQDGKKLPGGQARNVKYFIAKGEGLPEVPLDRMVGIAPSMIDLAKNRLSFLPDALFMLPLTKRLVMLSLSHNLIEALPDSIGSLTLLK